MKKMGFDEKLIIKYLKENQFNSITTVYYLLLKQNYHINGKSSLINQEYNKETILNNFIDKIKKRAKCIIIKSNLIF